MTDKQITDAELAEWRELGEKATGDEWFQSIAFIVAKPDIFVATLNGHLGATEVNANGRLIVASRTAMPRLIAEVERLKAMVVEQGKLISSQGIREMETLDELEFWKNERNKYRSALFTALDGDDVSDDLMHEWSIKDMKDVPDVT